MDDVSFITFCHHRDWERLAANDELSRRVASNKYPFYEILVVRQRMRSIPDAEQVNFQLLGATREIDSEDHPNILEEFGINPDNPKADEMTHGPTAPHYWKWHVINHLIGLKEAKSPYVVFSDADCRIKSQPKGRSWIEYGIELLNKHSDILIVSPSDGGSMAERRLSGGVRLTQNVSQQMFLCNRARLSSISFDMPWDWEYTAPGGPMQEYYYMLEGRMWRWMNKNNAWRAILPKAWRYWHDQWH